MTETADFFVSFSQPAVIFEDAYDNSPTEHVNRRSTTTLLTIHAEGGSHGGMFTLTRLEGLGKLCLQGGGAVSPRMSDTVAPGQSYVRSYLCEGCVASGEANDIKIGGTFIEDETDGILTSMAEISVVKIELHVTKMASGNSSLTRHVYGIDEVVNCLQQPSSPQIQWAASGSGQVSNSVIPCYECPLHAEEGGLTAAIEGIMYRPNISVIEPGGIECVRYGFMPSDSMCGIGMALELHVVPDHVSFEGLWLKEVAAPPNATSPEWGIHTQYFDDLGFNAKWFHYSYWGAGVWIPVSSGNRWGEYDTSRMFVWPQPWSSGVMTWVIPIAWRGRHSPVSHEDGRLSEVYCSEWRMGDGAVVKSKYRQELTLTEGGLIFLNGEQYVESQDD